MTMRIDIAAKIAAAGLLAVGSAVVFSATAAADPSSPPPDLVAPLPPGTPIGEFSTSELLLGQYSVPSIPGGQPAAPPDANALNTMQFLMPSNFKLAQQGQTSTYTVGPVGQASPPASKWDYIQGAHGLWHTVMGKIDQDQLGRPLPGTAPPPGTNIPAGLADDLPDPVALPPALPPDGGAG